MIKKALFLFFISMMSFKSYSQIFEYRIGKYKAILNFYKNTIKWEKGTGHGQLAEENTNERNVRVYKEIIKGKVTGTFEIYNITNGEEEGTFTRADGTKFNMKIIRVIKA